MTGDSAILLQLLALRRAESPVTADEVLSRGQQNSVVELVANAGQEPRRSGVGGKPWLSLPRVVGWAALILVIFIAAVAISAINLGHKGGGLSTGSAPPLRPPSTNNQTVKVVTSVPESVYEEVGLPSEISNKPVPTHNLLRLTAGGKPEVLYVWATYCPFCAAENWALVMALSKFGTFDGVGTTFSSTTDFAPDTPTLDLYRASYFNPYLKFVPYDVATDKQAKTSTACNVNGYACLQTVPGSVYSLFQQVGDGSMPFLDFANDLYQSGAGFQNEPLALAALAPEQVAERLYDPANPTAKAEVGEANYFVSAICKMTGDQPASVCASTIVAKK
jgi:thiol-disulfide isomerase/thioredoxin